MQEAGSASNLSLLPTNLVDPLYLSASGCSAVHEKIDSGMEFLTDEHILTCIKTLFSEIADDTKNDWYLEESKLCTDENFDIKLLQTLESDDRVDCSCNKPCEVPLSPSVTSAVVDATMEIQSVDDMEGLSSGDELDKLESDTDSQDTVIEGEAYKRIRSVAIKEKILHANEELFKKCDNSNSESSAVVCQTGKNKESGSMHEDILVSSWCPSTCDRQVVDENELKEKDVPLTFSPLRGKDEHDLMALPSFFDSDQDASFIGLSALENHFLSLTSNFMSASMCNRSINSGEENNCEMESQSFVENNVPNHYVPFKETTCSSGSSDNGSDGEEVILSDASTSSDEAIYIAPSTGFYYNQPISYALDTIMEESCEESEKGSRGGTPTRKSSGSGRLSRISSRSSGKSVENSDAHSKVPDVPCDKKVPAIHDVKQGRANNVHAILATSRLEKYFMSRIYDSNCFSCPDDDLTDESGGLSSEDDESVENFHSNCSDVEENYSALESPCHIAVCVNNKSNKIVPVKSSSVKCFQTESPMISNNQVSKTKGIKRDANPADENESNFDSCDIAYDPSNFQNCANSFIPSLSALLQRLYYGANKAVESCNNFDSNAKDLGSGDGKLSRISHSNLSDIQNASDDEAKHITSHVMHHIVSSGKAKEEKEIELENISHAIKILECEIARLMLTVSPASLSVGEPSSSCSSTIGSNNSDYGSDTLESGDEGTTDEEINEDNQLERKTHLSMPSEIDPIPTPGILPCSSLAPNVTEGNNSTGVSDETLYICKQLVASLKKIADTADATLVSNELNKAEIEDHTAKQYIADQIVSLMQTVNASRNGSPLTKRNMPAQSFSINVGSNDIQDGSDVESPRPHDEKCDSSKSKTPSESGSETTISASISIPSYDDSDCTPTESEISHEMDELYALLETNGASTETLVSSKLCSDSDAQFQDEGVSFQNFDFLPSDDDDSPKCFSHSHRKDLSLLGEETSLLYGAASKLESLLPIPIEERIERYKAAFVSKGSERRNNELKDTKTRIHVILPQPLSLVEDVHHHSTSENQDLSGNECSSLPVVESDFYCESSRANISSSYLYESCPYIDNISCSVTSVKITPNIHNSSTNLKIDGTHFKDVKESFEAVNGKDCSNACVTNESDNFLDNSCSTQEDNTDCTFIAQLPKGINQKEKASSENDLLVANYRAKSKGNKVFGTKSAGNISELESINNKNMFRDTGYYSFKSSEESILSLDDSAASRMSTASLTQYRSLTSTETIPEEEESCSKAINPAKISLSSGNIPDAISDSSASKSSTLPLSVRGKLAIPGGNRSRSSFFSTSGVLRKLTLLRDEGGASARSSPHGRLRVRSRTLSGGSEDGKQKKNSVPQISVSDCPETQGAFSSVAACERESTGTQDDDLDQVFAYHSRSQMSLSSFGARSESMTSVYSAAGGGRYGTVIVTGDVLFSLNYNYKAGSLEVHVKECRNLAPVDTKRNRSDPYAKVYLLPDRTKSGKRKTKVKKHTLSPVFDEVLKFQVTVSELETRTLWLSVWHSDMFGRNDFLGEVMLPLGYDTFENYGLKWHPLQERLETIDSSVSYKGDIILALKFVPPDVTSRKSQKRAGDQAKGALHVLVKEARNLMATRSNGTSDPFCKSYLLPDKSKSGKQKTPVVKKCCNPKWNHTFVYDDLTLTDLRERCLELTIWDYDKITSNDFLGGVRLSLGSGKYQGRDVEWMDSVGEEVNLWYTMLDRPNMWVDGSLLLRSSMQSRRT